MTTYPVRLREWVRPGFDNTRVCPTCNGRGWVAEPIRVYYQGEWRDEAAVTVDCIDCYGTGRVPREDNEGGTE